MDTLTLAEEILAQFEERNVEPTTLRVLALATDLGLTSEVAQAVAEVIERRISGSSS